MSYEGYVQCICDAGHYFECDAFDQAQCSCGAAVAWDNDVDQTNCDSWGEIPFQVLEKNFLISPEQSEVCNLGHQHVAERAVFRIPQKSETDGLRTRFIDRLNRSVSLEAPESR